MSEVILKSNDVLREGGSFSFQINNDAITGQTRTVEIQFYLSSGSSELQASVSATVEIGQEVTASLPVGLAPAEYALSFLYDGETETGVYLVLDEPGSLNLEAQVAQNTVLVTNEQAVETTFSPQITDNEGVNTALGVVYSWNIATDASGADAMNYTSDHTLTQEDVGKFVQLQASYTDDAGMKEVVFSDWTEVSNVNDEPAGALTIDQSADTLAEEVVLTANLTNVTDLDGLPSDFIYTWLDGENTVLAQGAEVSSFVLGQSQVGQTIRLEVSYTDLEGMQETLSATTLNPDETVAAIDAAPVVDNTGLVILGDLVVGSEIKLPEDLLDSVTDPDLIVADSLTYQWYAGEFEIAGATQASYTLTEDELGDVMSVVVSYRDEDGFTSIDGMNQFTVVATGAVTDDQLMTGDLILDYTALQEDEVVTINISQLSDANGLEGVEFAYQWYRDGVMIEGATDVSYTLTQADVGSYLGASISYTDNEGFVRLAMTPDVISDSVVLNTQDDPSGLVILGNPIEGEILTATELTDEDGLPDTLNYQWYRDGILIEGANQSEYQVTAQDRDAFLSVTVQYQDAFQTGELTSEISAEMNEVAQLANASPTGELVLVSDDIIDGEAPSGTLLSLDIVALADANGLSDNLTIHWFRDENEILNGNGEPLNTLSYQLTEADEDFYIYAQVSYVDADGYDNRLQSNDIFAIPERDVETQGSITLSGALVAGSILTVDELAVDDVNGGITGRSYLWTVGEKTHIGESYLLTAEDVGQYVAVDVTYRDALGGVTTLHTESSYLVLAENQSVTGNLVLEGDFIEGAILNVSDVNVFDADGQPELTHFEWYHVDGQTKTLIEGVNGDHHVLTQADVGYQIEVVTQFKDTYGSLEKVVTDNITVVENLNNAPKGYVALSGSPAVGQTLSAVLELSDQDGFDFEEKIAEDAATQSDDDTTNDTSNIQYQWYADDFPIFGAIDAHYVLTDDDEGKEIYFTATYTDNFNTSETLTSLTSAPVLASPLTDSVTSNGYFVTQEVAGQVTQEVPDVSYASEVQLSYLQNKLIESELTNGVLDAVNEQFTNAQNVVSTLADMSQGDMNLSASGKDAVFVDASSSLVGQTLGISDESNLVIKGNSGLKLDTQADTNGLNLILGNDIEKLLMGEGNDQVTGSLYGDVMQLGGGNNDVNGGDGIDHLLFAGSQSDYELSNGQVSGSQGLTAYDNVEYLHFSDGLYAVDEDGQTVELNQEAWVLI